MDRKCPLPIRGRRPRTGDLSNVWLDALQILFLSLRSGQPGLLPYRTPGAAHSGYTKPNLASWRKGHGFMPPLGQQPLPDLCSQAPPWFIIGVGPQTSRW